MQLGVLLGYWGLGLTAPDQLRLTRAAEELGYDSAWTSEAYGSDAATVLAWLAAQTTSIRLGAGVFQIPGRTPAMTAMTAMTIDRLSGGRLILGLGTSGPQVSEGWHGVRFARQLGRTREYVDVVRLALSREPVTYAGETLVLPLPDGPGKALKLTVPPVQASVPIYLAALGPNNVALAGEIADGWLPILLSPAHIEQFRGQLTEGAGRAGREVQDVAIAPIVNVRIDDDVDAARDALRPFLALYLGGMGPRGKNFYVKMAEQYGFADAAGKVQDLYLGGLKEQAAAAIPDGLIDIVSLVGPADSVRDRLAMFRDAGVDTLIVSPALSTTVEAKLEQLRIMAELREALA